MLYSAKQQLTFSTFPLEVYLDFIFITLGCYSVRKGAVRFWCTIVHCWFCHVPVCPALTE